MNKPLLTLIFLLYQSIGWAQLQVVENNNAMQLAQRLVGSGVIISNATLTNSPLHIPAGFFNNISGTNIGIDSGIVLATGRVLTANNPFLRHGINGNGVTPASSVRASTNLGLPGDITLANELGVPQGTLFDGIALEFDFIPLGDTIRFDYILSSEEYTATSVCTFNDAFGFFISGPGITGNKNIALVPNSTTPVTITNVNNIVNAGCVNNPQYYVDNTSNVHFIHEGHTAVFTAISQVVPCETYHLKLVISDVGDRIWDSGVFLKAKSLKSNAIGITNLGQTDAQGNSYLVEGCVPGAFSIHRPRKEPTPLSVTLSYGGDAVNGVDVQLLPTTVTIPANDSFVMVDILPNIDNIPEGIERLVVYALAGCAAGTAIDSAVMQLRDYDILSIAPGDTGLCKNTSVQLTALAGFSSYQWDTDPTLSNAGIANPVATPTTGLSTYYCTAVQGNCQARDSITLKWRDIELQSSKDVNCRDGRTGVINVLAGYEWQKPVEFSIDGINWQSDSTFGDLPTGVYNVRVRDQACTDNITLTIQQAFPDLGISNAAITDASCSGAADGSITLTPTGGKTPYRYSSDGNNFQTTNVLQVRSGSHPVTIRDDNGCLVAQSMTVPLNNTVTVDAGQDTTLCEGIGYTIPASSNASSFLWTPQLGLAAPTTLTPLVTAPDTTMYFITATTGICTRRDSMTVNIRPAPIANAGNDVNICFGKSMQLSGSGGTSYRWTPNTYLTSSATIPDPTLKPQANIEYSLMVKDIHQCESITPDKVKVTVIPAVKMWAVRDTVVAINQPLQLHAIETNNAGVTSYRWSPVNFLNDPNIASPVATIPYDITYTVTGTTPDGCEGSTQVSIKAYKGPEIYVPSGFSPNNDGLNDILRAIPVGIKEFHFFRVYNRWGEVVFATNDPKRGWDGRIKGVTQDNGHFLWTAHAVDYLGKPVTRKGSVIIIR